MRIRDATTNDLTAIAQICNANAPIRAERPDSVEDRTPRFRERGPSRSGIS